MARHHPDSDLTELRGSIQHLEGQLSVIKQNVQDLSCQFTSFQNTMLENLHALQTKILDLRQQQSNWHKCSKVCSKSSGKKIRKKKLKLSEGLSELKLCRKPKEASTECHLPSSTTIPVSFPSTLSLSLPSFLLPTFIDSIIVSVSPSISQI